MRTDKFALVCALLVISILEPITAGRGYKRKGSLGHGYPPSSGHSGAGHHKSISIKSGEGNHGHPGSVGQSGRGSHGYPGSVGQSGGGSHGYPGFSVRSGGDSHGSPSSPGGKSEDSHGTGYLSSSGSHGYPSSGPRKLSGSGSSNNTHHSKNHGYPAGSGSSNNTHHSNSHRHAAGSGSSNNTHHSKNHGVPAGSGSSNNTHHSNSHRHAAGSGSSNNTHHSNSHGYAAGSGSSNNTHQSNSHGYPAGSGSSNNTHHSNSHGYPADSGSSNNTHHSNSHGYPAGNTGGSHGSTTVHYPYNYSPPKLSLYTPVHGGAPIIYPVYHGSPPTDVYKYKDSGSKYGTLLAGLSLFNLAKIAPGTAAHATAHNKKGNAHGNYKPQPGDYCTFGVKKDNGDYEETGIDCQLITSFILQADQTQTKSGGANKTTVTTTVTNITTINSNWTLPQHPTINTTKVGDKLYQIMANGALVPGNETALNSKANANGITSVVTTVSNTTTVIDALDVKGQPIAVTPGMQCFVIRHTSMNIMRKTVPCGLLQNYAEQSLKANLAAKVEEPPQKTGSAARNGSVFIILAIVLGAIVLAIVLAAFVYLFL